VQVILRNAINTIPHPATHHRGRPRILLTTFPQEPHGLGLLMAEALFSLDGGHCISLGVQTPIWDIVLAATTQSADIVALSFSAALNPNHVLDGLTELRAKLPRTTEVWAGGGCLSCTGALPRTSARCARSTPSLRRLKSGGWRTRSSRPASLAPIVGCLIGAFRACLRCPMGCCSLPAVRSSGFARRSRRRLPATRIPGAQLAAQCGVSCCCAVLRALLATVCFTSFACCLDLQGQQVVSASQTLRVLWLADGLAQALGQDLGVSPLLL
jgi:methylmalonyl-CoA mutase cobalamin-binding subunit